MNAQVFRTHIKTPTYPSDSPEVRRAAANLDRANRIKAAAPDLLRRWVESEDAGDADLKELILEEARELLR